MRYALNNGSRDVLTMTIDQGTGELSFTIEGRAATGSGVIKFVEMGKGTRGQQPSPDQV
jgi:hypothetical protein